MVDENDSKQLKDWLSKYSTLMITCHTQVGHLGAPR